MHRLGVGINGFVMPAPELHLKLSKSFAYTRCDIAIISVEVTSSPTKSKIMVGASQNHF